LRTASIAESWAEILVKVVILNNLFSFITP